MTSFKFQLLSDLHLEFSLTLENLPPFPVVAPYLFLVGDIGYPSKESYSKFLFAQSERFKGVFILAGNHEFYKTIYQQAKRDIIKICEQKKNLYFMDKTSMLVDGIRILGTTLWSFVPTEHVQKVTNSLTDYHTIYIESDADNRRLLTVADTNAFHQQEVEWLKQEILKASNVGEYVIVLTHHAPSFHKTSHPRYDGQAINCAFQTNLEYMIKNPILIWCFGHTHYSSDQLINGIRVVSNQAGYIMLQEKETGFNASQVISIDLPQMGLK